jgi:hypothetical protein
MSQLVIVEPVVSKMYGCVGERMGLSKLPF